VVNSKRIPTQRPVFGYNPASSGNRFPNFTLLRGSAIIGATVSRHT
jgi:hypothetical protein